MPGSDPRASCLGFPAKGSVTEDLKQAYVSLARPRGFVPVLTGLHVGERPSARVFPEAVFS